MAADDEDASNIDQYKKLIKAHPLFPILEHVLFKCERSTVDLSSVHTKLDIQEIRAILTTKSPITDQQSDAAKSIHPLKTGNDELDQLMLQAIQVLRIQLFELEKVEELCKDFCSRYTACLKGKVTQEMLLGWSDVGDDESCSPPPSALSPSTFSANNNDHSGSTQNDKASSIVATMETPNGHVSIPLMLPLMIATPRSVSSPFSALGLAYGLGMKPSALLGNSAINGGPSNTWNGDLISAGRVIAQPTTKSGNTAGCLSQDASRATQPAEDDETQSVLVDVLAGNNGSKGKRGSLPRQAVDILRSWLFQHMKHPYPSEEEKRELCTRSGLNLLQVNNWFINARRRILQPLLDGVPSRDDGCNQEVLLGENEGPSGLNGRKDRTTRSSSSSPKSPSTSVGSEKKKRSSDEDSHGSGNEQSRARYWPEYTRDSDASISDKIKSNSEKRRLVQEQTENHETVKGNL